MKIKVLIVEDEVLVAEDISDDLQKEGFDIVGIAISSDEALELVEKNPPHVILMDIHIKGDLDGIETAEQINQTHSIPIIYVTSNTSKQFVNRAVSTKPHAFISKPYNVNDLVIAMELAFNSYNERVLKNNALQDTIFVRSGEFHRKVQLEDVLYIEADGSYCTVVTSDANYTLSNNLNHFQSKVQNAILVRVHRSFVVNLSKVDGIDKTSLLIRDKIIPVSNSYKASVFDYFNKL